MASYKERLERDLDRWIGSGLVPAENRAAILHSVPEGARMEAATALTWVGGVLAGVALIAFVAANWDVLPRLAKFALVLGLYAASAGAGAWLSRAGRSHAANGLLTFAAFAFASAIGLTGQIFDITGDERTALYAAGVGAAALALAGRSSGAAIAALWFVAAADFAGIRSFDRPTTSDFAGPFLAVPAAAALAWRWKSVPLAHAAALGAIAAAVWLGMKLHAPPAQLIGLAVALGLLAAAGRWLRERGEAVGGAFYAWLVWGAMAFYLGAGIDLHDGGYKLAHRVGWLILGGALVALGRRDRVGSITGLGVLSLMIGVSVIMYDLGLGLMTASAVFLGAAIVAGIAGLMLRRRTA
ncbi:MAG TPA: DUF2157 domain-containing protein [Caulobacteraceae bacterium]|nr:DUF2157 domain-containing protein [Caulobacteraceae bacterium]